MNMKFFVLLIIVSVSVVYADGPLSLKGFHSNMSYKEACKNMSELPLSSKGYTFIEGREQFHGDEACGWGHGEFDAHKEAVYEYRIFFSSDGRLFIGHYVVDILFASKDMNIEEFSQSFIDNYSWIDSLNSITAGKIKGYEYRSVKYGWEIKITLPKLLAFLDTYKTINVKFFNPPKPKFD